MGRDLARAFAPSNRYPVGWRLRTRLSVSDVDHNTLQSATEDVAEPLFLQSTATKYGVHVSRPGNGICHGVHIERLAVPEGTLLGSGGHTPTAGGMGMLAIGGGGLNVAVAMAGESFLAVPERASITNMRSGRG